MGIVTGRRPWEALMSVWQIPLTRILTSTSSARGSSSTISVISNDDPGAVATAAFIRSPAIRQLLQLFPGLFAVLLSCKTARGCVVGADTRKSDPGCRRDQGPAAAWRRRQSALPHTDVGTVRQASARCFAEAD